MSEGGTWTLSEEVYAEIAYLYVNLCGHNATRTIRTFQELHPDQWKGHDPNSNGGNSSRYIKNNKTIQKYIKQYEEENRKQLSDLRIANIATLSEIAFNPAANTAKDRIAALKELNSMFGYNSNNINVNGKVDSTIEIVIE